MTIGTSLGDAFRAAWLSLRGKPDTPRSREPASGLDDAAGGHGPYARVTARQSLVKSITWRGVAALDTFAISYLITGRLASASSIVGVEVLTKTVVYYGHERVWSRVRWGTSPLRYHPRPHGCRSGWRSLITLKPNRRRTAVARLNRRLARSLQR
jgi:uncharacterized membrane protein